MAPTDELKQALLEQRLGNLEKNHIEVIARALKLPEATVVRVLFAANQLNGILRNTAIATEYPDNPHEVISEELRAAIRFAMEEGGRRQLLRFAIETGKALDVSVEFLVMKDDPGPLCNGCPERIECIAESLHTPEECFTSRKRHLQVFPIRVTKTHVEVEATQPAGRHIIPLHAINLRGIY